MRVAPVALLAYRDLDRVEWLARHTALITHAHELGIEGAVLQACAIARLLAHPSRTALDRHDFLQELRGRMRTDVYRRSLDLVESLAPESSARAVAERLGNGIEAHRSAPTALFLFLRKPDSFTSVVFDAISLGGDTDTIASMTAALSGAWLGEAAIPNVWRQNVEGAEHLQELANELLGLTTAREAAG